MDVSTLNLLPPNSSSSAASGSSVSLLGLSSAQSASPDLLPSAAELLASVASADRTGDPRVAGGTVTSRQQHHHHHHQQQHHHNRLAYDVGADQGSGIPRSPNEGGGSESRDHQDGSHLLGSLSRRTLSARMGQPNGSDSLLSNSPDGVSGIPGGGVVGTPDPNSLAGMSLAAARTAASMTPHHHHHHHHHHRQQQQQHHHHHSQHHMTGDGSIGSNDRGSSVQDLLHTLGPASSGPSFIVKNEIVNEQDLVGRINSPTIMQQPSPGVPNGPPTNSSGGMNAHHDPSSVIQHMGHHSAAAAAAAAGLHPGMAHVRHHHLMGQHHLHHLQQQQQQQHQHLFAGAELAAAAAVAAAAAAGSDPRHHLHYGSALAPGVGGPDCLTTQKAVAFLAGPRERIHVLGNPVEHCPRCQQEGLGNTNWRPHRHIGELKIRYICERHFDDLESNHHFDIPLCPICNQVLYLYDFNSMLGVSNARRLHKYVLKCANRHVLPLLDLFCQTKKGGERCNANFKLQWCYGTMVKRCEAQKNRDHDLWWVRYKNEWKQRRTIIRYKKDFLSHLTDAQRSLLLGLGLEGEPPPDPKSALGPTFDALVSSAGGSPSGPKIKKRAIERGAALGQLGGGLGVLDGYDMNPAAKRRYRSSDFGTGGNGGGSSGVNMTDYSNVGRISGHQQNMGLSQGGGVMNRNERTMGSQAGDGSGRNDGSDTGDSLRHVMGAVVIPSSRGSDDQNQMLMYLSQQQQQAAAAAAAVAGISAVGGYGQSPTGSAGNNGGNTFAPSDAAAALLSIPSHLIITGTPTPPLPTVANGTSPVAVAVVGEVLSSPVTAV